MEAVALGVAVGLFAGILPGAFFMLVATTALERGVRQGLAVAFIPLGTEPVVFLVTVLTLTRLPEDALRWVGIAGGLLLLFIAWKVVRDARDADPGREARRLKGRFVRVAVLGVLEPGPWIFWFFIGAPLFLNRWHQSPLGGILFLISFLACFVGVRSAVAWAAAKGRRFEPAWYRRTLKGAGGVLLILGLLLVWQSWVGNFEQLIRAPERIEQELGL